MNAGGRPDKSAALAGASVAGSVAWSVMSTPGMYHCMKASMTSRSKIGASALSVNDGRVRSAVVDGYHSNWKTSGGPALSQASWAITAEMLAPAESPATAI